MKIGKILVANRGEIACRVLRTARAMGLETVTVHTEHDRGFPHADGESVLVSSYLALDEIVRVAKEHGADAIHPGYGFLAENPALPRACAAAGVTFIGPLAEAMEKLGDKAAARRLAQELGIPVAEGEGPFREPDEIRRAAERVGPPLMLKASAGGGGKGMKRLLALDDLPALVASSQRESLAAFGDDRLIVERYVDPARHVEVQIVGDGTDALALGERECSLQRRHQKIIEESPSTAVTEPLRSELCAAARRLAAAAGYVGAGTVEFLLGPEGRFYFLELNARLQVEHPVTELCTGLDLVRLQIQVAEGAPLPDPSTVAFRGHAIEARLCAEDPRHRFLPSVGRLLRVAWPGGVRVDTGVGDRVTPHYDSLLAKIIAWGETREEARQKLLHALRECVVLGVMTNQSYLVELLESDAFVTGQTFTSTVDRWEFRPRQAGRVLAVAAALALRQSPVRGTYPTPWETLGYWRQS